MGVWGHHARRSDLPVSRRHAYRPVRRCFVVLLPMAYALKLNKSTGRSTGGRTQTVSIQIAQSPQNPQGDEKEFKEISEKC